VGLLLEGLRELVVSVDLADSVKVLSLAMEVKTMVRMVDSSLQEQWVPPVAALLVVLLGTTVRAAQKPANKNAMML
jgi:hypothetical protein